MQKMVDIGHIYTTTYLQSGIHLPSCIKHLIAFPDTVDSGIFKFITPGNTDKVPTETGCTTQSWFHQWFNTTTMTNVAFTISISSIKKKTSGRLIHQLQEAFRASGGMFWALHG